MNRPRRGQARPPARLRRSGCGRPCAAGKLAGVGCEAVAQKARGELARIGGRPSGPRTLTPTEQRVAELIASGRTTRQAADALFVTPRAIEANLAKIYRKLGISSRAELGA